MAKECPEAAIEYFKTPEPSPIEKIETQPLEAKGEFHEKSEAPANKEDANIPEICERFRMRPISRINKL